MKLILSYHSEGIDKRLDSKVLCFNSESPESLQRMLHDLAFQSLSAGRRKFDFGGEALLVDDFLAEVNPQRYAYAQARAASRGLPLPEAQRINGRDYRLKRLNILPLEQWFERQVAEREKQVAEVA